jgi:hypothetical protein
MNVQDFGNYASLLFKNYNVLDSTQDILTAFNYFSNNNTIIKDSKHYRVFSKIVHENHSYNNLKQELQLPARQHSLKQQQKLAPFLSLNQGNVLCDFYDL